MNSLIEQQMDIDMGISWEGEYEITRNFVIHFLVVKVTKNLNFKFNPKLGFLTSLYNHNLTFSQHKLLEMGKKKQTLEEDLVIPKQDGRICGVICICQMTLVLSAVAIVYLTVAVYMPSMREFDSGINVTPIMCTTTKTVRREACDWVSCAEWCLSNPSGSCSQIFVNLRRNGSSLMFNNCSFILEKKCIGIDMEEAPKLRCILEHCKNLTGLFNCTGNENLMKLK